MYIETQDLSALECMMVLTLPRIVKVKFWVNSGFLCDEESVTITSSTLEYVSIDKIGCHALFFEDCPKLRKLKAYSEWGTCF